MNESKITNLMLVTLLLLNLVVAFWTFSYMNSNVAKAKTQTVVAAFGG